ncbi:MAG TPA: tRNA dihydrouridine synthase DusB [Bacteroidota bacterium]|nr:tRNA dihydrouridine synthase DusB [Bacteroidota bacterium]
MVLGKKIFERPLLLAPMEDVTDLPFRLICKRLGADILFTEFVNSDGLVRNNKKTAGKMHFTEEERPIGIQIYGSNQDAMEGAARMADEMNPDFVDINAGCWVKDVVARGAGAGLLRDLPRMEKIVAGVVKNTTRPVTVKTRLGWDDKSIHIIEVAKMLEQNGVQALTVHCRTRGQGHSGDPDFSWIPLIKAAVSLPVIVNGSLVEPAQIKRVMDESGCDGVMIGRGAIDNPWIFKQTKHYFDTGELMPEATVGERIALCIEHLRLAAEYKGERRGVIEMRKHYAGYLHGIPNVVKFRISLMQYLEVNPLVEQLQMFAEARGLDESGGNDASVIPVIETSPAIEDGACA